MCNAILSDLLTVQSLDPGGEMASIYIRSFYQKRLSIVLITFTACRPFEAPCHSLCASGFVFGAGEAESLTSGQSFWRVFVSHPRVKRTCKVV